MGADDRVFDGRGFRERRGDVDVGMPGRVCALERPGQIMHGMELLEQIFDRVGKRIVGREGACEAGIASRSGELNGPQDRTERRVCHERVVAVPDVGAITLRTFLIDHEDFGIVPVLGHEGRETQLPKATAEGDVLGFRDVLIPKEENLCLRP